jgi:DNA-binding beta-propeller fold protein YncE
MRTFARPQFAFLFACVILCLIAISGIGCGSGSSSPSPGFTLAVNPSSVSVAQGAAATYTVTLTSADPLVGKVTLSVIGLPVGMTATFAPTAVTPTAAGASATLTVQTTPSVPLGTKHFTLNAASANKQQEGVTLIVTAPVTLQQAGPIRTAVDLTAKFVYVANEASHNISQFKINADGTLSLLATPTVPVGHEPLCLVVDPAPGTHTLYVAAMDTTGSALYQFNINTDGTLTPLSPASVSAGTTTVSIVVTPDGKYVYVINFSNGNLSQYKVNADGTLTPLSPATVSG